MQSVYPCEVEKLRLLCKVCMKPAEIDIHSITIIIIISRIQLWLCTHTSSAHLLFAKDSQSDEGWFNDRVERSHNLQDSHNNRYLSDK